MQEEIKVVDPREKAMGRQYLKEFLPAMLAYTVLLPISILFLDRVENDILRGLLAVVPVVPLLFAMRAFLRHLNRLDELQQRIQLHAVGFAAGATALITFTLGLLENAGLPHVSMVWVLPILIALWGLSQIWYVRRYA